MARSLPVGSPLGYLGIKETNPPQIWFATRAPTADDYRYDEGDIWIDRAAYNLYMLAYRSGTVASWTAIGIATTTAIESITADSGTVVPVANVAIFTGDNGLEATGSGNTLTYRFTPIAVGYTGSQREYRQTGVQTSDATVTQIASIDLDTNTMVSVLATFRGFRDDYSANCGGFLKYTARRAGAGALETAAPIVDFQKDSVGSLSVDADVSGNSVRMLVQGIAAEDWVWTCTYDYALVKTAI